MKIYLTDLQAYNEGNLVGRWIELPIDTDDLQQTISEVLNEGEAAASGTNGHEEYFITDYESSIAIDEYDDVFKLNELAEITDNLDANDLLKLKFLSYEGYDERKVLMQGINGYEVEIHDYSSDTSFTDVYELLVYDLVEEGLFGEIPLNLVNYIDYSAIGRDLSMEYTEFEHAVLGRVLYIH